MLCDELTNRGGLGDWNNGPKHPCYLEKGHAGRHRAIHHEEVSVNKTPLIGLTGYAYAGKDTAAQGLLKPPHSWNHFAFATALKYIATDLGWDGEKDEYGRRFLQKLGESVRTNLHPDAWIAPLETLLLSERPTIVTDVRYYNEAEFIRSRGGLIVRITRPDTQPVNEHISETDLDTYSWDVVLHNDHTISDLQDRLVTLVSNWWH